MPSVAGPSGGRWHCLRRPVIPGHCRQNLEKMSVGLEDYGSIIWLPHQTIGV